jgi:hypothetical protein
MATATRPVYGQLEKFGRFQRFSRVINSNYRSWDDNCHFAGWPRRRAVMWINSGRAHGVRNERHHEHQAQYLAVDSVLRLDRHSAGHRRVRCNAVRPLLGAARA